MDALASPWVREGDAARWFSRSAWSLAVLARWRQRKTGKAHISVWVPDFFCNESLALLRGMGAQLTFYPIDDSCKPATDEFPRAEEHNRPDLFLLVHYFGAATLSCDIMSFCLSHGAWLVEDAAHALCPAPGIGDMGDIVLYSPHKLLAIPDGAVLVVRGRGPARLAADAAAMAVLDESIAGLPSKPLSTAWHTGSWLAKRLLQGLGFRRASPPPAFAYVPEVSSAPLVPPSMSMLGKRLLVQEISRLPAHAASRLRASKEWAGIVARAYPDGSMQVQATRGEPPYLACAMAINRATAESFYARFSDAGVPVSTWPDLAPEVGSPASHPAAWRLRHTRVYLPTHASASPPRIASCVARLGIEAEADRWRVCRIKSQEEWERHWSACPRKSMPQSWEYGAAKAAAEGWRPERYLVLDPFGTPVALFQVLLKGWPRVAQVARINRGPLMLCGDDSHRALRAIAALLKEARRRRWRMMQIAPLLLPHAGVEQALAAMGFRKRPDCPADSAVVPLRGGENDLLLRLSSKWRNCLRKGQRLGVKVEVDDGAARHLQLLLDFYAVQQREKRFDGTSSQMLCALAKNQGPSFRLHLFVAYENGATMTPVGIVATVHFGDASEYLIGVTNERGRALQANSVLLWNALLHAKAAGCEWFDVGGLSAATPKGIADFKKGMNGCPYSLVGEWRCWP